MSVHFPNFSSEHIHCKVSWVILLSHQKSLCLNFTTWLQHWKGVLEKCGQPTGVDGQLYQKMIASLAAPKVKNCTITINDISFI